MGEFIGELIGGLIVLIPLWFALWHQLYNDRQRSNEEIAKKIQNYISFDESTRTLCVYDFHPLIWRVVTMDRYEILHTKYQPETYTYTSVRVGNVTIGDVSKNDAYKYISGSSKTDKYELLYLGKSITKIMLCSQEVIDKARRAGLNKYMNSAGEIVVVGQSYVSQDALKSALSGYYAQMQIEGLDAQPSYDKCKRIFDFLNSAKGQPVPKEKRTPAQIAALKKTLVGFLVFFLLMGGIFVMLIPSMMADEIVRDLNGTYMALDPEFFDGTQYTIEIDYERYGDSHKLFINGIERKTYIKKITWTKMQLSFDSPYSSISSPLILKYKWIDGEATATKLLDREGNVLWPIVADDKYNNAISLMEAGQYEEAIKAFKIIEGYKDSTQLIEICRQEIMAPETTILEGKYADAVALMDAGQYEEAISAFEALGNFKDSSERAKEAEFAVKYIAAESLLAEGKTTEAAIAFGSLGDYQDARERSFALWDDIIKPETISASNVITVAVKSDGTVVTAGVDWYNEKIKEWTDIVAISVSGNHLVGLRADGTVVAVADTDKRNYLCNVGGWTDIVAIATGAHTVGLRADGTVLATGSNENEACNVSEWTDIVAISASAFHTVGLRSDGTVVAVGKYGTDVANWSNIVAVSAGRYHTVGLRSDGTVVSTKIDDRDDDYGQTKVSEWTDIVAISAHETHTVGLRADGTVVSTKSTEKYYNGQCDTQGWTNIVAVSAGLNNTVALRADGSVVATRFIETTSEYGTKTKHVGQCNVSSWKNIKLPN